MDREIPKRLTSEEDKLDLLEDLQELSRQRGFHLLLQRISDLESQDLTGMRNETEIQSLPRWQGRLQVWAKVKDLQRELLQEIKNIPVESNDDGN